MVEYWKKEENPKPRTGNQIIRNLNKELIDDCVKGVMELIKKTSEDKKDGGGKR